MKILLDINRSVAQNRLGTDTVYTIIYNIQTTNMLQKNSLILERAAQFVGADLSPVHRYAAQSHLYSYSCF